MKKIICVLLVVMMLMGTAFAEEEFTLHNGTKFGMSGDDIVSLESEAGIYLSEDEAPYGKVYEAKTTVAGVHDTALSYMLWNDELYCMTYSFTEDNPDFSFDEYFNIENGLIQKYGETQYSSQTQQSIPSRMPYKTTKLIDKEVPNYHSLGVWKDDMYSQRLVPLSDGSYVFIIHQVYSYYWADRMVYQYFHKLSYNYLLPEEADEYLKIMGQIDSDL